MSKKESILRNELEQRPEPWSVKDFDEALLIDGS